MPGKSYKKTGDISGILAMNSPDSLALALESISECVSITDDHNMILYVNRAFLNTYGYERKEILGKSISILRCGDYNEKTDVILKKTREGHWQGELVNKRKDGTEFPVFISTSRVEGEDGSFISHIGVAVDITEQRKLQEHYRVLVDYSLQGLLIIQHGRIAYSNHKASEIFGYSQDILMNFTESEVLGVFHPLDRKSVIDINLKVRSGLMESGMLECRIISADHQLKWVQLFSMKTNFRSDDAVQYAFIDISEKKSAELGYIKVSEKIKRQSLALREFISYNPDDLYESISKLTTTTSQIIEAEIVGIWVYDKEMNQIRCLDYYDQRTDTHQKGQVVEIGMFPSIKDLFQNSRLISLPNVSAEPIFDDLKTNCLHPQAVSILGIKFGYGKDFQGFVCCEHCSEVTYWSEEDQIFLSNISDLITFFIELDQRNQIVKVLRDNELRLSELVKTKDTFLSVIAHDLKNPYHAIAGFSELLYHEYDRYSDEEKKLFISKIFESAQNTYKLLQNLLDWANLQSEKIILKKERLDLSIMMNDTLFLLKPQADNKNISVNSEIAYGTEVAADENIVKAILRNLITNAIHFSWPDSKILVSAKLVKSNVESHYQVKVADQGVGISPESIKKIFRIEEKFRTKGTSGEFGTGVGLILTKDFVEISGGKIWVESVVGKGSSFYFTLPVFKNEG